MQLIGQAAIVRELNVDDDIVDRDIAEDTDRNKRSECQDGETKMIECNECFCSGGRWLCTKTLVGCKKGSDRTGIARRLKESDIIDRNIAKDTDRSKRSECRDGTTMYYFGGVWCTCIAGESCCNFRKPYCRGRQKMRMPSRRN